MGSQSYKHHGRRGGGGGGGGEDRRKESNQLKTARSQVQTLLHDKKFRFAASVVMQTALNYTHTDVLFSAAIAAAKGYEDYQKHEDVGRAAKTAGVEFAKDQATSLVAGAIASGAVKYASNQNKISLDESSKEIIQDAVSAALEETFKEVEKRL